MFLLLLTGRSFAADATWTLDRAIRHALTNSPDARIAGHRIAAARAGLEQARSAYWPQIQLQSSYTRSDNPVTVFGTALNQRSFSPSLDFNNVPDVDNLNVRGLVTLPLYNGGRTKAGRDSASASLEATRFDAETVAQTLAFEVARAFHTVTKAGEFIRATEAAVESFESNLSIAQKRFNAGTILKTELLDVEVRLAQAREDRASARNARLLAERALRNLLGIEQGELAIREEASAFAAPDEGASPPRPELTALRERQRAAEAEVRRAQGGHLPRVSAFASLDHDRGWKLDGSGESYTAGVVAQWDLWDGRLTRSKVSAARAELAATREEERKLRLSIDLEVEQARLHLAEAVERLAITDKSAGLAAESAALTRARFEQGLALATQLIDAETALTTARVRRAEAEADRRIAVAALRKARGLSQLPVISNPQ
jgi:outer membrane protein TolC